MKQMMMNLEAMNIMVFTLMNLQDQELNIQLQFLTRQLNHVVGQLTPTAPRQLHHQL